MVLYGTCFPPVREKIVAAPCAQHQMRGYRGQVWACVTPSSALRAAVGGGSPGVETPGYGRAPSGRMTGPHPPLPAIPQTFPAFLQTFPELLQTLPELLQNLKELLQTLPEFLQNLKEFLQTLPEFLQNLKEFLQTLPELLQTPRHAFQRRTGRFYRARRKMPLTSQAASPADRHFLHSLETGDAVHSGVR